MRPFVPSALFVGMLLSHPVAHAHDDRGRGWERQSAGRPQPDVQVAGWGKLRNRAQDICLDAAGWAARGSANALLGGCNNDPDQVWFFAPTGEIKNAESGLCLTPAARPGRRGGGHRGADVGVDRCDGSPSQNWTVAPRGRGVFELRNNRRGLCLDVDGRRGGQGDDVLLWACDGGVDQLWWWEPTADPRARVGHRPPPYPRDVPVAPEVQPMHPAAFNALMTAMKNASFSTNQMAIVEEAAAHNHFLVVQLREIVQSLSFSSNRVRAVELIAPRLLDPENGFTVLPLFTFSRDQEQVKRILGGGGRSAPARAQVVPDGR